MSLNLSSWLILLSPDGSRALQNIKGRNKRQGESYNHTSFITQALARYQTNKLPGLTFTIIAVKVIKASMFE